MENRDNPAFPLHPNSVVCNENGLTKREYFAGLAMQSIANQWDQNDSTIKECARRSIKMADELLKQLDNA